MLSLLRQTSVEELKLIPQEEWYKVYQIKQGSKSRTIEEPHPFLKEVQRDLLCVLESFPFHAACMAMKGKSILSNAIIHDGAEQILRVDIKSCYPSITSTHVLNSLLAYGSEEHVNLSEMLLRYCFIKHGDQLVLPTGAPTSPVLCNIALTPLDYSVEAIAMQYNHKYSRYIDDLNFSTTSKERCFDLKPSVEKLIKEFGLYPNYKKNHWMRKHSKDKFVVTGVKLDGQNKVPREFARMLRAKLQNLAKAGKELDQETKGCLAYVYSIAPDKHEQFLEYFQRRKNYGAVTT